MSVYEIVFSPVKKKKKVSDIFTKSFCTDSNYIDLTERKTDFREFEFSEDDICIVSVPSYGGRVPGVAVSRLEQIKGNKARTVLIVVYGNRAYEDTFTELQDVLERSGFSCIAAVAAVAEHSIMHQFATGRPDSQDEAEIASFAKKILSKMEQGTLPVSLKLPGNRPYREYGGIPIKPKSGKLCNQCGICADKCPVGAIPVNLPSETDYGKCISCMRCTAICPQNARNISKTLLTAGSMKMKKACSGHKINELFI